MHSDFRFPKVTVTLMGLILLAVFLAIQKAKDIQASIAYANPQAGPNHATQQLALLPTLLFVLASACVIGLLGWVILFALRRSGSHRLSDVDTSMPPPMHIVTMPKRALRRCSSRISDAVSFAPVHPSGCPSAIAPPFGFTRAASRFAC